MTWVILEPAPSGSTVIVMIRSWKLVVRFPDDRPLSKLHNLDIDIELHPLLTGPIEMLVEAKPRPNLHPIAGQLIDGLHVGTPQRVLAGIRDNGE